MGRKGSWFSAVKKVISPENKNDQKNQTSKKQWFAKNKNSDQVLSYQKAPIPVAPPLPDFNLTKADDEQSKHAYSLALATAAAAEAAVAAAQAAAETIFRGYLARRALRALRGLVRLKTLIQGQSVRRQAATTLRYMQTLSRLQSQIRARRIRMSEQNQALQRQLQQRRETELEKMKASVGERWDDTLQSKDQIKARQAIRQEAAIRRERALAYAHTHQQTWRNSPKPVNPSFMDPNNPHWGWSWLERWMAARPWEGTQNEHASVKSAASSKMSVGDITKLYSLRDTNHDNKPSPSPAGQKSSQRRSPSTPAASRAPSLSSAPGKARSLSSKGNIRGAAADDSRSLYSVQSERNRRHSIAGSSMRDDESLASSHAFPIYSTAPTTKATNVRSKTQTPSSSLDKNLTRDKASVVSAAKRRLSFPASPAGARSNSVPAKNASKLTQQKVTNGGNR
ncbi:hypothetical protein L6164_007268 [Bauhinia variegata]|uniref:Uncharacterized protein n=1 Tax=Bauhinia variegata TaxID=167791 RepID=A0ACB9PD78_BAUVA|nr:hypothetical protein L6164_007268 [Bauhinia variegata]